jgi:hypothetical protein
MPKGVFYEMVSCGSSGLNEAALSEGAARRLAL